MRQDYDFAALMNFGSTKGDQVVRQRLKFYVNSFPRSGNTWTRSMLTDLLDLTNIDANPVFHRPHYGKYSVEKTLDNYVQRFSGKPKWKRWLLHIFINRDKYRLPLSVKRFQRCVIKSHEKFDKLVLKNLPIIYLVRDGRDSLLSYYYQFVKNSGYTESFDSFLRRYLKGEPINYRETYLCNAMGDWGENIESYLNKPNTLFVRYEDLKADTFSKLKDILEFLKSGHRISHTLIDEVISHHEKKLLTREPYPHSARGYVGGWRRAFTEKQARMFWDRHGDLLLTLGYR